MIEKASGLSGKSPAIFGSFRKCSEPSSGHRNKFGQASESSQKYSENHQKHRHQYILIETSSGLQERFIVLKR